MLTRLKRQAYTGCGNWRKKCFGLKKENLRINSTRYVSIKKKLFPGSGLQERYDNLFYYYAKWGQSFINRLEEHSLAFEQKFVVLSTS